MTTNTEDALHLKAKNYCEMQTPVHVSLNGGRWKRGTIKEVKADFFMLVERVEGLQPVFFIDVLDITFFSSNKPVPVHKGDDE